MKIVTFAVKVTCPDEADQDTMNNSIRMRMKELFFGAEVSSEVSQVMGIDMAKPESGKDTGNA